MNRKHLIILNIVLFVGCILYYCLTLEGKTGNIKAPEATPETIQVNPLPVPDNETPSIEELIESRYTFYNIPLTKSQQIDVQESVRQYNLSYELVLSIMYVESKFNTNAISKTNDYGTMQMNSPTFYWCAKQLGIENPDPLDFNTNLKCGTYYLDYTRDYWVNYGSPEEYIIILTASGYHRGIKQTLSDVENDTMDYEYINKVLDYKYKLESGVIGCL
jgi:soluble lytic murein transglycosylase-like protein